LRGRILSDWHDNWLDEKAPLAWKNKNKDLSVSFMGLKKVFSYKNITIILRLLMDGLIKNNIYFIKLDNSIVSLF
jgi:hypothetical protein